MLLVLSFKGVRYLANNHSALRLKGIILAIVGACLWGLGGTVSDFLFKYKNINVDWYVTARLVRHCSTCSQWCFLTYYVQNDATQTFNI